MKDVKKSRTCAVLAYLCDAHGTDLTRCVTASFYEVFTLEARKQEKKFCFKRSGGGAGMKKVAPSCRHLSRQSLHCLKRCLNGSDLKCAC